MIGSDHVQLRPHPPFLASLGGTGARGRGHDRVTRRARRWRPKSRGSLGADLHDDARHPAAAWTPALLRTQSVHGCGAEGFWRGHAQPGAPILGGGTRRDHAAGGHSCTHGSCAGSYGADAGIETSTPNRLLRSRDHRHDRRHALAGNGERAAALPHIIALSLMLSQLQAFIWLAVALIASIIEVSIPHFGFAFVAAGAVAAAAAAFLAYGVPAQFAAFVIVLSVSLVALRSRLLGRL